MLALVFLPGLALLRPPVEDLGDGLGREDPLCMACEMPSPVALLVIRAASPT